MPPYVCVLLRANEMKASGVAQMNRVITLCLLAAVRTQLGPGGLFKNTDPDLRQILGEQSKILFCPEKKGI